MLITAMANFRAKTPQKKKKVADIGASLGHEGKGRLAQPGSERQMWAGTRSLPSTQFSWSGTDNKSLHWWVPLILGKDN